MARRKAPIIADAVLDQLLAGADPKSAFDPNGLLDGLKKALAERALNAEMDQHLANGGGGNCRSGYGRKRVLTDSGALDLAIPRDRRGSFEPQLIAKYQRRFPGFDEKIIALYARGLSTREKYPAIVPSWRRAWTEVIPFFAFPPEVRRIIYTTNAIEALNSKLRTAVRARGHFPSDDAALKLLFLVLNRAEKEWTMPAREWCMAKAQFAVLFGERFTKAMA